MTVEELKQLNIKMESKIPTLILPVGIAGSGKSTWAIEYIENQEDSDNWIRISTDDIREELCGDYSDQSQNGKVFELFHSRIITALKEGKNVIADATNILVKSRKAILDAVRNEKVKSRIEAHLLLRPVERCIRADLLREKPVFPRVIESQYRSYQVPFYEEGFDSIRLHYLECEDQATYEELVKMVDSAKNHSHNNHHHKESIGDHSIWVRDLWAKKYPQYALFYEGAYKDASYIHDVGKLFTCTTDKLGENHYKNHANVGAQLLLYSGCFLEPEKENVDRLLEAAFLINYHMIPYEWEDAEEIKEIASAEGDISQYRKRWLDVMQEEKFNLICHFHEVDGEARISE